MKYTLALCALLSMTIFGSLPAFAECGVASIYGGRDHLCGHRTASGERFNCGEQTAAHKHLPFGTVVHVNGCAIRINDRGPFVRGRIIDLSPASARCAGVHGTARVCI